jgi:hypothetical protein
MHRPSEFLSYEAGPILAEYAWDSPKSCASAIVPLLTRELHEPNDQIRRYAAEAIADLRVAARDAVPDLLQALKLDACLCRDAVCDKRSGGSTELIRVAMLAVNGSEGDPALYGCGYSSAETATPSPASEMLIAPGPALGARSCSETFAVLRSLLKDFHDADEMLAYEVGPVVRDYAATTPSRCEAAVVSLLVRQLRDPSDLVRLYAAQALGKFGPSARRTVPALLQALKLDKCVCRGDMCVKGSWSSTGAIEFAMIAITGSVGDWSLYNCAYSGSVPMQPTER